MKRGIVRGSILVIACLSACVADDIDDGSGAEAGLGELEVELRNYGPPGDFEAEYVACDEFAGVGVVALDDVIDLVPDDYTVIEPIPGLALVVAQAASCDEISVDGWLPQPGTFAQFGVGVVPPLTPGAGDFYQLTFVTDHPVLAGKLAWLGVPAHYTSYLSYEIDPGPTLDVDVPCPLDLAFELDGPITLPDPMASPNPTTVFNYYAQTPSFGNVLQQNVVEGIRFGQGAGVVLTAVGSEMQDIVGGTTLMFPFFSAPETFDSADLLVETHAF